MNIVREKAYLYIFFLRKQAMFKNNYIFINKLVSVEFDLII